jgi:hypothetical protein
MTRALPIFLATTLLALETGKPLPTLKGEFLSGKKASLPEAAKGKIALVLAGFSYDSRFAIEAYVERYKKDFKGHPGITFFEVPIIGGMGMLGKPFIDSGMRRGTPKELHENVITVYGGAGDLRKAFQPKGLKVDDKHAHLALIDAEGIVRWSFTGPMDDAKYLEFKAAAEKLLQ